MILYKLEPKWGIMEHSKNNWSSKYWDIVRQLYWTPKYLGLKSIKKEHWITEGDRVSIPAIFVKDKSGPLYIRDIKENEMIEKLMTYIDPLTHIFNLTFSIAADFVVADLFFTPFGFTDKTNFRNIGRERRKDYDWGKYENVAQPDAFFVGEQSIVGVELKINNRASLEQIIKYTALMVMEEKKAKKEYNLGMLFIIPKSAAAKHWKRCKLNGPDINAGTLDLIDIEEMPKKIQELIANDEYHFKNALDRLQLKFITWDNFQQNIKNIHDHDNTEETLKRLLNGFTEQANISIAPSKKLQSTANNEQ